MNAPRKALFIIGSPRRERSTSSVLASNLSARLQAEGLSVERHFAVFPRPSAGELQRLARAVDEADLLVLVFPLYVDQLPAGVVAALEHIHAERHDRVVKTRWLSAIVNCGFPEASQNDTALSIVRRFAELDGMEWLGGLSRGMGGAIAGRPLEKAGMGARGVGPALDLAATALSRGLTIPPRAIELMATPPYPDWIYRLFGNIDWYRQAGRHGTAAALRSKPAR